MKISFKGFSIFTILSVVSFFLLSFGYVRHSTEKKVTGKKISSGSMHGAMHGLVSSVYDSLHLENSGLSKEAYEYTVRGIEELKAKGELQNDSIVTICDFSRPSSEKRMYIIDLNNYRVLFNTWVAHGRNSGKEMAASFSNTMSSNKSSLGFYRTGDTYIGGNGYSLKLHGLEKGINDRALERAIVLHGADYVSPTFLQANGFMGRSYGCPAVSSREAAPIINAIKGGTCLFIYSNDRSYLAHSALLQPAA
ncbi:MAG: murein L,D-transpeptidase catalytic domain family protein [Chitinophagaceae bacterium]|nr:MAG: murein L,D-transpeptidase catalytic domain family protein [Chitinophagaceae bacterium]